MLEPLHQVAMPPFLVIIIIIIVIINIIIIVVIIVVITYHTFLVLRRCYLHSHCEYHRSSLQVYM